MGDCPLPDGPHLLGFESAGGCQEFCYLTERSLVSAKPGPVFQGVHFLEEELIEKLDGGLNPAAVCRTTSVTKDDKVELLGHLPTEGVADLVRKIWIVVFERAGALSICDWEYPFARRVGRRFSYSMYARFRLAGSNIRGDGIRGITPEGKQVSRRLASPSGMRESRLFHTAREMRYDE